MAAAAPFGLRLLAADGAQAHGGKDGDSAPAADPGSYFYSLADAGNGPLRLGSTQNKWNVEIGYAGFQDGAFFIHHNSSPRLYKEEWISSQIGTFSILEGALMVEVRGDLSDLGCFGLEMHRQQYKDRRWIRANWFMIDPPSGMVSLESDGEREMQTIAEGMAPDVIRPIDQWNQMLFLARGNHFEGWVNGAKVIEADNDHFGRGRIGLVAERMDRAPFRTYYRNLHVWDGLVPDPTTVWG